LQLFEFLLTTGYDFFIVKRTEQNIANWQSTTLTEVIKENAMIFSAENDVPPTCHRALKQGLILFWLRTLIYVHNKGHISDGEGNIEFMSHTSQTRLTRVILDTTYNKDFKGNLSRIKRQVMFPNIALDSNKGFEHNPKCSCFN